MKQFLLKLLLFAPFAVLFYVGMVILWGELAPVPLKKNLIYNRGTFGHTFSRLGEAKHTTNVDVLFLGSSTAYRGFDTEFFREQGLKTFNLGSSSQTPTQPHLLLKKYLDGLHPKLVVYEVDERYSTTQALAEGAGDPDAAAACIILEQFLRSLP